MNSRKPFWNVEYRGSTFYFTFTIFTRNFAWISIFIPENRLFKFFAIPEKKKKGKNSVTLTKNNKRENRT